MTSTYGIVQVSGPFTINQIQGGSQTEPAVVGLGDGGFVAAFRDANGAIKARRFSASGAALGDEVVVAGGVADDAFPRVARLANGNVVITWSDDVSSSSDVSMRIFDATLAPVTTVLRVNPGGTDASNPDVAPVIGGGFVVAYELQRSASDHDIYLQRYDASGAALLDPFGIDTSFANTVRPSVAGLRDGGVAIAYAGTDPAVGSGSYIARALRNIDGSLRLAATVTDATGSTNRDVDVAALSDGGFILSYADSDDTIPYVRALTFSAQGTAESSLQISGGGSTGQAEPSVAVSADGFSVVSYTSYTLRQSFGSGAVLRLLTPDGTRVPPLGAPDQPVGIGYSDSAVAWLDSSRFVQAYANFDYTGSYGTAYGGDGDGYAVTGMVWQVERTSTGDDTAEVLWLDGLSDRVSMLGGADVVFAGDGNNTVDLGAGNDAAAGGSGPDALLGGAGSEWLYGVGGNDYLYGGADPDVLFGGEGDDYLYGDDGDDYAFGETGNDAMAGGAGIDRFYGGEGNDTLYGGEGIDALYGGAGADLMSGDAGDDFLQGEAGDDTLMGGAGKDVFFFSGPGEGNDTVNDLQAGDVVVLAGYGLTGFADVAARMSQSSGNVVLSTSDTSSIVFWGKTLADVQAFTFIV